MLTLFTLPTATTTFTEVSNWSGQMFTELLPLVYLIVGMIAGALIVKVVVRASLNGVKSFAGGRRGRRGRR